MPTRLPPFFARLRFATSAISTALLNLKVFGLSLRSVCSPGFNCHGCPWATAACPVGVMAYGSAVRALPVMAIATILAIAAVLGRLVCSFACPFGLFQDLLHKLPSPKTRLPRFFRYGKYVALALLVVILPYSLGFVPTGYLSLAKPVLNKADAGSITVSLDVTNGGTEPVRGPRVVLAYQSLLDREQLSREEKTFAQVTVPPGQTLTLPIITIPNKLAEAELVVTSPDSVIGPHSPYHLYYCRLCPNGTLTATIPSLFSASPLPLSQRLAAIWLRLTILGIFLVLMVISSRPFCRLFCPLGAVYSLASPLAVAGMKLETDKCIQCGQCDRACPMDLDVRKEVGGLECIACGDCMKVCPQSGISRTWRVVERRKSCPGAASAPRP